MKKLLKLNNEYIPLNIKNLILDIDNCVFDSREWDKHIPTENTRVGWDDFHKHYYLVTPNDEIIDFVKELVDRGLQNIFFITSREEALRDITETQLRHAFGDSLFNINSYLYMRNMNDYAPSSEIKGKIFEQNIMPKYFVDLAIDDDMNNVEMYRKNGIVALYYNKFVVKDDTIDK